MGPGANDRFTSSANLRWARNTLTTNGVSASRRLTVIAISRGAGGTRAGVVSRAGAGATQIRDPATPQALGYVRRMMLNMDPPEHARLRRLLGRSFTPRAVAQLEHRIRDHARAICDRAFAGRGGECDFAKDVAAELPLLTLADVLGVPEQDRWLLFDWSNRVIGYQDPDYATSAKFDPAAGTPMAREALSLRPAPGAGGPGGRCRW